VVASAAEIKVMPTVSSPVLYATGDEAQVGDRVDNDGMLGTVEDVVASAEDQARWNLAEPGVMMKTEEAGLVFQACSSFGWTELRLLGRRGAA
jgi:hypothetical protein